RRLRREGDRPAAHRGRRRDLRERGGGRGRSGERRRPRHSGRDHLAARERRLHLSRRGNRRARPARKSRAPRRSQYGLAVGGDDGPTADQGGPGGGLPDRSGDARPYRLAGGHRGLGLLRSSRPGGSAADRVPRPVPGGGHRADGEPRGHRADPPAPRSRAVNFADRLLAGRNGARPALITLDAEHSYGQLSAAVSSAAVFLLENGAGHGECVGIAAENSFFWVAAYLGSMRAGCVAVPVSPGLTERDRAMAVLPFHYSFGASVLQTHLAVGGTVVIDKRFLFPDKVLQRMIETRCTGFAGVPSHYQILLRKSCFKQMGFPDLRWLQQAGG